MVSSRFLAGITHLSLPAPVPPLALLERQLWIPRLGNGSAENIEATDVLCLAPDAAQAFIELLGIASCELLHFAHSQQLKVT
jgi:hypothetical protein